jgi:hypothetical protein
MCQSSWLIAISTSLKVTTICAEESNAFAKYWGFFETLEIAESF